jgi:dCMP deaminase
MMSKHEYICKVCEVVASKSTCDRANVGAIFINEDYEIISTGYNGSPKGFIHCSEAGHIMVNNHCERTIHAEINAIIQAAKRGTALKNSILYVTHFPCERCSMVLANLGIKEIHVKNIYRKGGLKTLVYAGITCHDWEGHRILK